MHSSTLTKHHWYFIGRFFLSYHFQFCRMIIYTIVVLVPVHWEMIRMAIRWYSWKWNGPRWFQGATVWSLVMYMDTFILIWWGIWNARLAFGRFLYGRFLYGKWLYFDSWFFMWKMYGKKCNGVEGIARELMRNDRRVQESSQDR